MCQQTCKSPHDEVVDHDGRVARLSERAVGHQKRDTKKGPAETGGRNGASIAKFRTRRPAHICETSRYRAVFERPSYVTRWRRTGWLGRRDSNLCILDCNSPKTPSQGVRIRTSASWNRDLSSGPGPELAYLELQVRRLHSQKTSQASDRRPSPLSHDEVHQNKFAGRRTVRWF